ncbi:putative choline kinase [Sesamum alatum]|uniref:Choline kinase n=1 Tax=Sesamum alatum TaxID=300844 RepID=A0AAE2CZG0_9LAMI|nr:putative choline kinase [Sesamum alatum]
MCYHATRACFNGFPVKHRHLATALCAIPKARLSFPSLDCRKYRVNSAIQIPRKFHSLVSLAQNSMGSGVKSNKEYRIPEEAKKILKSLAAEWTDISDADALQVIPLKGAMTNEVYQIKWLTNSARHASRKVLVRIYGSGVEVFFNRENEIRTFEFMSKQGQGPRLLGRFSNGRVEEFIRARTLTAGDLRDPEISALIATKMKEFHSLDMPGPKTVAVWDRLRKWLNEAKRLSSQAEAEEFRLNILEDEISALEKNLSTGHQLVGFCHNDLQYGNIMMDEETRLITIIDYEYASYNHVAFDIANHFCEMAADYHSETPHVLDYSKYPGLEERQRFLRIYLSGSGNRPSDLELGQLLEQVEKYTLASHLLWGLWGIISEHVNEIDFDYIEYARQRFQQYWAKKSEVLGFSSTRKQ